MELSYWNSVIYKVILSQDQEEMERFGLSIKLPPSQMQVSDGVLQGIRIMYRANIKKGGVK